MDAVKEQEASAAEALAAKQKELDAAQVGAGRRTLSAADFDF